MRPAREAGNSDSMLSAYVTVCACKRRCALQGRGGAIVSYGNDEQRRRAEKDAISCHVLGEDWYHSATDVSGHSWASVDGSGSPPKYLSKQSLKT